MPMSFLNPNILWILGLRRSQSRMTTLLPPWAMVSARLTVVAVLPSRGPALVTRITWGTRSGEENNRLVRMPR